MEHDRTLTSAYIHTPPSPLSRHGPGHTFPPFACVCLCLLALTIGDHAGVCGVLGWWGVVVGGLGVLWLLRAPCAFLSLCVAVAFRGESVYRVDMGGLSA